MREILKLLEKDSRTSSEQIATMLGRPVAEVEQTIRDAEVEWVIVRYKTTISHHRSVPSLSFAATPWRGGRTIRHTSLLIADC